MLMVMSIPVTYALAVFVFDSAKNIFVETTPIRVLLFVMKHNMITSASGWRKVFAASGNEQDSTEQIGNENKIISVLAAGAFAQRLSEIESRQDAAKNKIVLVGTDTRPTGKQIACQIIKSLAAFKSESVNIIVKYAGIVCAPEIMAAARSFDAFVYVSASHNPIGHNGIKFGFNDGGVLSAQENERLLKIFNEKCDDPNAQKEALNLIENPDSELQKKVDWIYAEEKSVKAHVLSLYDDFEKTVIAGSDDPFEKQNFFASLRKSALDSESKPKIEIICDMNGSARTKSIDKDFLNACGIAFSAINDVPGKIAHEIIPEPENLVWCARELEKAQAQGRKRAILGYMPDCDGDRGNIVYWNSETRKCEVLKAQEVFALSVLAETAFSVYQRNQSENDDKKNFGLMKKARDYLLTKNIFKPAVVVNGPTSMRIDEIAAAFNAEVFRAEVGEANVVNLAREKREEGYTVRICGEGSNGGNITHPAAVRDPLNTLFAIIKLLLIKDEYDSGVLRKKGLFRLWCEAGGQIGKYSRDFTIGDVIKTLPAYTTTGVSEPRAILRIKTEDHGILKRNFQKIFEEEWPQKKEELKNRFGIFDYEAISTSGTKETKNAADYSTEKKGGIKIVFKDKSGFPQAFIWMRGSKTEPVFRIMCDVKGFNSEEEKQLLEWETKMLLKADK